MIVFLDVPIFPKGLATLSKLEVVFCDFQTENNFVNLLSLLLKSE